MTRPYPTPRAHARQRGAMAILAMMFLVIFGSLAAAMAIVSQGNLRTADSHMKINRSLAACETGTYFIIDALDEAAFTITSDKGVISSGDADDIWLDLVVELSNTLGDDLHYVDSGGAYLDGEGNFVIGPIAMTSNPNDPSFVVTITPHPLVGEDYDAVRYQQEPYVSEGVSNLSPPDSTWLRVVIEATDGPANDSVTRVVSMDMSIEKRIPFALLSRSRIMVGRNVMIDGPVGSLYDEVHLEDGHPVQIASDFRGLNDTLDARLDALLGALVWDGTNGDTNGDNRINTALDTELGLLDPDDPETGDVDADGYIDEFDLFLGFFDTDANGEVTLTELEDQMSSDVEARQLLELIDSFGYGPGDAPPGYTGDAASFAGREGYNDGVISAADRYAKLRGEIFISANVADWNVGAADSDPSDSLDGTYQDYLAGPIVAGFNSDPISFGSDAEENDLWEFESTDFDQSDFRALATGSLGAPDYYESLEAVPYGAAFPYDYFDRPVYANRSFTDVLIPVGTNALFIDCTFTGVVFVDTAVDNDDMNYNYAGMVFADGSQKHPDRSALVSGYGDVADTKTTGNNIRFHDCEFRGSVVTEAPTEFTHTRNKLAFTGVTSWNLSTLNDDDYDLYSRSAILAPHFSVEMGTFNKADGSLAGVSGSGDEAVELTGTIVAGLMDIRGQVTIRGTLLTTFAPQSNTGPVIGDTSPQYNTTLGYFDTEDGDLEASLPAEGVGIIQIIYEPLPLPDNIRGPVSIVPMWSTYYEGQTQ